MRICLLTNQDLLATPFPSDDWPCDPRPFYPEAQWHVEYLKKATSVEQVTRLIERGFDLFFNLCDGAADQDTAGIEVVQTLEAHGVAFTGATSEFYEPSREAMKQACRSEGIDTPDYVLARCEADVERAAESLRFPLFVKHYSSYSSVDLSRRSRVTVAGRIASAGAQDDASSWRGADRGIHRRHGVHGAGGGESGRSGAPETYTPIQYRFPDGETFKHSDMKWVDYDRMSVFPVVDPVLDARLREVSARFFVALNGASFGRCDLRVDRNGTPFMLEINPNCGVYYPPTDAGSADLCLAHDPEGHAGFTRRLIRAALQRQQQRASPHDRPAFAGHRPG